ncbi:hypothetical protein F5884DRAFT_802546 [Xylogone sp. PMI_703]|nr:hypothetical protein F5884DRAFT_802546 [Xylogone sp. PMI_703]
MAISGIGAFFIIVAFVIVGGVAGWIIYTQLRARRLGLPRPTLQSYNPFNRGSSGSYSAPGGSSGGVFGWFKGKMSGFRNRSSSGAAEPLSSGNARGSRRGFGPLDPDEAWDARVGTEADAYGPGGYYEEQELGLHREHDHDHEEIPRGRSLNRNLAPEPYTGAAGSSTRRYDEEMGKPSTNPFDDSAEPSNVGLRGVSPRPLDASNLGHSRHESRDDSPTGRRSIFREDV